MLRSALWCAVSEPRVQVALLVQMGLRTLGVQESLRVQVGLGIQMGLPALKGPVPLKNPVSLIRGVRLIRCVRGLMPAWTAWRWWPRRTRGWLP